MFTLIRNDNLEETTIHGSTAFPYAVYRGGVSEFAEGYLDWHWHTGFEINLVTVGTLSYFVENTRYELNEGEAVFINAGRLHRAFSVNPRQNSNTVVFSPALLCSDVASDDYAALITAFSNAPLNSLHITENIPWQKRFLRTLRRLFRTEEKQDFGYPLAVRGMLCELFSELLKEMPPAPFPKKKEDENQKRLRRILTCLTLHYDEDLMLMQIADEAGLCAEECSRFFKRQMGVSLFSYLNRYRIEKACELLSSTDLSIGDIALSTGFNGSSYFNKRFMEQMHTTPSAYRKQIKTAISSRKKRP